MIGIFTSMNDRFYILLDDGADPSDWEYVKKKGRSDSIPLWLDA